MAECGLGVEACPLGLTWTPKVCKITAFYGSWAIMLPTFGGLGRVYNLGF